MLATAWILVSAKSLCIVSYPCIPTMHLYLSILLPFVLAIGLAVLMVVIFRSHSPWPKMHRARERAKANKLSLKEQIYQEFKVDLLTV